MSTVKSDVLRELKARGFIHQATDEAGLDKLLRTERVGGYIGFDCTAPSLHVGNLLGIVIDHATVPDANHFFEGRMDGLMEVVDAYLDKRLGKIKKKKESAA